MQICSTRGFAVMKITWIIFIKESSDFYTWRAFSDTDDWAPPPDVLIQCLGVGPENSNS